MKPSLLVEYLDQIPESLCMQNVHLHKFCCQNCHTFKGNAHLLAIQFNADGHPCPKGMQVFSVESLVLVGKKTKVGYL